MDPPTLPIPIRPLVKGSNGINGLGNDFELFGQADSPTDLPPLCRDRDSPASFSPPNRHAYLHRNERSSSLPAFERVKPPRRRTLELRDATTLFGTRSDEGSASGSGSASSGSSGEEGGSSSGAPPAGTGPFWNPHTDQFVLPLPTRLAEADALDSPLSIAEQQDLLDRMRRDLLGVDLDAIKGPFRALALSSLPRQSQQPIKLHPSEDSLSKTISPKEAFLDYNDVDHRLHAAKRLSSGSYGLGGVGSAGSLFAPLPPPSHAPPGTSVSSPIIQRAISTSPRLTSLPTPTTHRRNKSHPFSVPKNAVAWVDKEEGAEEDSTGGMVDFRESSDGDEAETPEEAGAGEGAADKGAPVEEAFPMPRAPKEADMDVESSSEEESEDGRPPSVVEDELTMERSRTPVAARRVPAPTTTTTSVLPSAFAPPPASFPFHPVRLSRPTSRPTSRPSPRSTSRPSPRPTSRPARSPRLASPPPARKAVNLEGEDSSPEAGEESSDEYVPAHTLLPRRAPRKRSRTPAAMEESESEASEEASGSSEEQPKGRRGAAPNKRRRRLPAPSTSSTGGTIRCTHVGPEGQCTVVFRRPYDLARHKETIHGEGGKGGKVDWVCKGCGGSFSRKDALIRHARIRGHSAGV